MHIQFKSDQEYQIKAIDSVTNLFKGQRKYSKEFTMDALEIVANLPANEDLWDSFLKSNLDGIQSDNEIPQKSGLDVDEGLGINGTGDKTYRYPSFNIEMETGTGKTYVYLRTILELRKQYGFSKFIIVVPSVAIYEGVNKTFEITKSHFRALFDNEIVHLTPFEGDNPGSIKNFATAATCEILLVTIQSFNRITNKIYQPTDKLPGSSLLPYQYIQRTRPILIIDEPQNMDTPLARTALRTLNPLFALRYSATHTSDHNLVYRLTPVEAFRQGLVKKVEVIGINENDNYNETFIALLGVVGKGKSKPQAAIRTLVSKQGNITQADFAIKQDDDLYKFTHLEEHKGYIVSNISAVPGEEHIQFANEVTIRLDETVGASRPAVFRAQIRSTITSHFYKQKKLAPQGIKVISLFFIDRVANYTDPEKGIIRKIFDEEYTRLSKSSTYFSQYTAEEVQESYFASYKVKSRNGTEQTQYVETEEATNEAARKAQKEAFELIMKRKEILLTLPEKSSDPQTRVAFIFAHSALKEGWDNPNVFQICTLNQTISDRKKRQEIGRGLRLSVNQEGERIQEAGINILTVIANQSYESYVKSLQQDYINTGSTKDQLPPNPTSATKAKTARNPKVYNHPDFKAFWEKLSTRLTYSINIDTPKLIKDCVARLQKTNFPAPTITLKRGDFIQTEVTINIEDIQKHQVTLKIDTLDTRNKPSSQTFVCTPNEDLSRIYGKHLSDYKIHTIDPDDYDPFVRFTNGYVTTKANPLKFTSSYIETETKEKIIQHTTDVYPVFDLISRAAAETGLTRHTINTIFASLTPDRIIHITKNPEGFASKFIAVIKSTLHENICDNITFKVSHTTPYDLEEFFPEEPKFVQAELMDAGENSIFTQVQIDSKVERSFVEHRLRDEDNVILYFKFPAKYRIRLPKVIGNYNPDWGIIYQDAEGNTKIQLIRETKGSMDKDALRFDNEKLKIICAEKYYSLLQIPYRQITDKIPNWWQQEAKNKQETI